MASNFTKSKNFFILIFQDFSKRSVQQVKCLACKTDGSIETILLFAEYHWSMFWPYGRVIKNSSGYHGECLIQNKPTLMYLGSTLDQANCSMDILREQDTYVKLNKALI